MGVEKNITENLQPGSLSWASKLLFLANQKWRAQHLGRFLWETGL